MTAPHTLSAPRARVEIAGVTLGADLSRRVLSVRYDDHLDLAGMATVTFDNADGSLTDSPLFEPGRQLSVHLGYGADLRPMFLGELTAIAPAFPASGAPTITITAYDRSHRLRQDVVDRPPFRQMNDSAIAARIAAEAGLIPVVDPSPFFHEELLHAGTDMALLRERAAANHFETYVRFDRLYFRLPRPQLSAPVLTWGRDLTSFHPRLSTSGTPGVQVVRGYDEDLAEAVVGLAAAADVSGADLAERLGDTVLSALARRAVRRDQPVKSQVDAANLAVSLLQRLLDGLYEADGGCAGNPDLAAGDFVVIAGAGRRFSGRYRLSRVTHTLDGSGYRTDFAAGTGVGTSVLSLVRDTVTGGPPAVGAEHGSGVVLAKVSAIDPARFKLKVRLPWMSGQAESGWITCATPERGLFSLPDEGDQVVVGFEQGDIGRPVVLGCVFDQKKPKPVTADPDAKNTVRRWRTAGGNTITLDDTEKGERIEIEAPKGVVRVKSAKDIELDARNGTITLRAKFVNVIVAGDPNSHMNVASS